MIVCFEKILTILKEDKRNKEEKDERK